MIYQKKILNHIPGQSLNFNPFSKIERNLTLVTGWFNFTYTYLQIILLK